MRTESKVSSSGVGGGREISSGVTDGRGICAAFKTVGDDFFKGLLESGRRAAGSRLVGFMTGLTFLDVPVCDCGLVLVLVRAAAMIAKPAEDEGVGLLLASLLIGSFILAICESVGSVRPGRRRVGTKAAELLVSRVEVFFLRSTAGRGLLEVVFKEMSLTPLTAVPNFVSVCLIT